ncbi:MAG: DNA-binding domain-containing protein [Anaerolineae bacterium]
MSISYSLHRNRLTNGANQYRAMVQSSGTITWEEVIKRMVARGSTTTEADAYAALKDFFTIVEGLLLDGFRVSTPLVNFGVSVKGNFDGQTDGFNASRHWVEAVTNPGPQLRRTISNQAQVQKQLANEVRPRLLEYTDLNSGERDGRLTPGGMGQVAGDRLKFDPADMTQGIFFVAADGSETRVEVVGKNTGGALMFLIPASLTSGDYSLEVRSSLNFGELRTGSLNATLTVS